LASNLEELTVDVDAHFQKLREIEEPLQRPFVDEALTKVLPTKDACTAQTHDVLLQDSISDFRKINEEKGAILRKLWEEWEETQFDIMSLAIEAFGKDSLCFIQPQTGNVEHGQEERLEDVVKAGQIAYDASRQDHADFRQDLKSFGESMGQISNKAKKTANDMHEVWSLPGPECQACL
jgi:hypothetical protein